MIKKSLYIKKCLQKLSKRFFYNNYWRKKSEQIKKKKHGKTIIFGAGETGGKLLQLIRIQEDVIAFLDEIKIYKGKI